MRTLPAVAAVLALSVATSSRAEGPPKEDKKSWRTNANGSVTIEDANLAFKLVLPKGTVEIPGAATGKIGWAFQVVQPDASFSVIIEKMGVPISREFPDTEAAKVKPRLPANVTLVPAEWQGLNLMVLRNEGKTPQGVIVDYGAQIPLSRDAIIVHVAGPIAGEAALKKGLTDTLAALSGAPRAK